MVEITNALGKLAVALNEDNDALRHALLAECWAEDGRLLVDDEVVASNRDELERGVTELRKDPEATDR